MKKPLNLIMEEAKIKLFSAFSQIQQETALPAYLMEGIVMELLAEIRNRKNTELISALEILPVFKNDSDSNSKNEGGTEYANC